MTDGEDDRAKSPAGTERQASQGPEPSRGSRDLDPRVDEDQEALRELLRGAMHRVEPEVPDVLSGVQRKIRKLSGGKFYSDAWSTSRHPPIALYLLTSLLMLFIVLAVYLVLSPTAGTPVHVNNQPAPVRIVPPRH